MSDILDRLGQMLSNSPAYQARIRKSLEGKVHYGTFLHDSGVAVRVNEDGTETFGRLDEKGFTPFNSEENAEFKRKFAWHFTEIFNKDNVLPFPNRKLAQD